MSLALTHTGLTAQIRAGTAVVPSIAKPLYLAPLKLLQKARLAPPGACGPQGMR